MRQRKLLLPPFHGERMREYEDTIVAGDAARHGRLAAGAPMRMLERTRKITLEVILRAVFGVEAERMGDRCGPRSASCSIRRARWRAALRC